MINHLTNDDLVLITNSIAILQQECHQNAVLHGFHEGIFNFGEKIALIHSEASEALEGRRKGLHSKPDEHCPEFTNEEIELADLVIRVLDLAGLLNLRLGAAIVAKHLYNKTRPFKHGKSF